jgi:hypothetical protein
MIWLVVIVGLVLLLIKFPKQTLWVVGIAVLVVVVFFWLVISDSERRTKEYQGKFSFSRSLTASWRRLN